MMIIISLLLLSLLFLAGFLNIFFHFPTNKFFHAWLKYTPPPDTKSSPVSSPRKERSATPPSPQNKVELKRVFATFDKNGDGFITKQELRESLRNIRIFMTEKEVEEIVAKVDANGDGLIEFDEFCMLCESMAGGGKEEEDEEGGGGGGGEEELKEAFDVFDKDRDGLITVEELGVVLCALGMKEGKKAEDCKEMITKVDMDGDGMVNFDEFKRMMKGGRLLLAH